MDNLDREILETKTGETPAEKIRRLFGKEGITNNYAKHMLTGIRLYINERNKSNPNYYRNQEAFAFKADGSREYTRDILLSEDEAADPATVMRKMGFDPLMWELIDCKLTKGNWDTTIKDKNNEAYTKTNYSYRVSIKVRPLGGSQITTDALLKAIQSVDMNNITQHIAKDSNYSYPDPYMLELPILDVHLGKLSWNDETHGGDYDLKIAGDDFTFTVNDLIDKVTLANYQPEEIVFPIGQDFFHFDNPFVQTTGGTQLDSDTRWQKMYRKGIELLIEATESLRKIAPLYIYWVPGNHDMVLSYAAAITLQSVYAQSENVIVDASPTPRKYHLFGKCLIGYAHGREEGKRIDTIMQLEAPEAWAVSEFREMHLGDLHHEETREEGGITFRRISSITAPDAWHTEKAYSGAVRRAPAFIWSKNRGLEAMFYSTITKEDFHYADDK